jgi:hypothetical protein
LSSQKGETNNILIWALCQNFKSTSVMSLTNHWMKYRKRLRNSHSYSYGNPEGAGGGRGDLNLYLRLRFSKQPHLYVQYLLKPYQFIYFHWKSWPNPVFHSTVINVINAGDKNYGFTCQCFNSWGRCNHTSDHLVMIKIKFNTNMICDSIRELIPTIHSPPIDIMTC